MIDLIYCAGGNRRLAEIALRYGMLYGAQMPDTVYFPTYFVDQDWKRPNRAKYMAALGKHRPALATVLDWERPDQEKEVMSWAEEAAQFVTDSVIIIPKVNGTIDRIPETIGGKRVRLGFSVPTKYGGTKVPTTEFNDRPVHLLGGSPKNQRMFANHLNVQSADGNYLHHIIRNAEAFRPVGRLVLRGIVPDRAHELAFELSVFAYVAWWRGETDIRERQLALLEKLTEKPFYKQISLFQDAGQNAS